MSLRCVRGVVDRLVPTLVGLLCLAAGCNNGRGRVELAALSFRAIDPPAPRFGRLQIERCFWWTDDSGQVWIAMECDRPVLLGSERFVFQLSLVLEKLPAGRQRNYLVTKRELRAVARLGPAEGRFVSVSGIVALYCQPRDRLRGSFRIQVARETLLLLSWSRPCRYLMMGTFEAVRDEERGRRIAMDTEAPGWERGPPPVSQPATQPSRTTQPSR